eukprot:c2248_g1_i1.p1 GENE.c2248_g1_i1~~c2248_g1_i1.p1  ORF type:complete len:703 (-),score=72.44 c2248_g1_i1:43-2028(-)
MFSRLKADIEACANERGNSLDQDMAAFFEYIESVQKCERGYGEDWQLWKLMGDYRPHSTPDFRGLKKFFIVAFRVLVILLYMFFIRINIQRWDAALVYGTLVLVALAVAWPKRLRKCLPVSVGKISSGLIFGIVMAPLIGFLGWGCLLHWFILRRFLIFLGGQQNPILFFSTAHSVVVRSYIIELIANAVAHGITLVVTLTFLTPWELKYWYSVVIVLAVDMSLFFRLFIARLPVVMKWAASGKRLRATLVSLIAIEMVIANLMIIGLLSILSRRLKNNMYPLNNVGHLPLTGCAFTILGSYRIRFAREFLRKGPPAHLVRINADGKFQVECSKQRIATPVSYKWYSSEFPELNQSHYFKSDTLVFCVDCGKRMQAKKDGLHPSAILDYLADNPGNCFNSLSKRFFRSQLYWIDHLCTSPEDLFEEMPRAAAFYILFERLKLGGWFRDSGWLRWESLSDYLPWIVPWAGGSLIVDISSKIVLASQCILRNPGDLLHVSRPFGGRWALQASYITDVLKKSPDSLVLCAEPEKRFVEERDPLFGRRGKLAHIVKWQEEMTDVEIVGTLRDNSCALVCQVQNKHYLALHCELCTLTQGPVPNESECPRKSFIYPAKIVDADLEAKIFWDSPQQLKVGCVCPRHTESMHWCQECVIPREANDFQL